jgi:hypothetical protein
MNVLVVFVVCGGIHTCHGKDSWGIALKGSVVVVYENVME